MSFGSWHDAREQVREAIDIADLVGRYVQLRRQGRLFVGLCPWHDDTRPSLQVNPQRQSFKCWVCDIGGDIFSFVMKMEGVTFPEALAMLADQAGIELKPKRPGNVAGSGPSDVRRAEKDGPPEPSAPSAPQGAGEGKRTLYRAMAWAETQYHNCLLESAEAEPARRYLRQRGITPESIRKFHLGFSPNSADWLLRRAGGTPARARILEAVGILARSAEGSLYDRFRGRVLFPIRDTQDRPIALGGRVLPESGSSTRAKYINSPETPLFTKSRHLYGLDIARAAMRKTGRALVMEGYTDCIVAHQHGFEDAVAVLGTALGDRHVQILKRFADRIVLVLDGDEAGQRRANEVLALFLAENVDLRIVTLPEGLDPADFLHEHGAEAFRDLLASRSVDAIDHVCEVKSRGIDLKSDVHGASRALEEILATIAAAPRLRHDTTSQHRLREEKTLARLAFMFRVSERTVRERLTAIRRQTRRRGSNAAEAPPGQAGSASQRPPKLDPWEREFFEVLIRYPEYVPRARAEIDWRQLASEPARRVLAACCRLLDAGSVPTFERLMLSFDDPALKSLLVELDEEAMAKEVPDPQSLLDNLIQGFRRQQALRERELREGVLRQGGLKESEEFALLRKITEDERARQGISDPADG